jgi:hypothetical protein
MRTERLLWANKSKKERDGGWGSLDRNVRAPNPREKERKRKEGLLWANKSKKRE